MPNRNKYVSLFTVPNANETGGAAPLSPATDWVAIYPAAPGNSNLDGRSVLSLVNIRYRADVTVDTMLRYTVGTVTRDFFVRGVQNVNEANDQMNLLCEEVAS